MRKSHLIIIVTLITIQCPLIWVSRAGPAQLDASRIDFVRTWADVYQVDRAQAVEQFGVLLGTDYPKALEAFGFFRKADAYEIAASALSDAHPNIRGSLIHMLARAPNATPTIIAASIAELERRNAADYEDDGEKRAGSERMKSILAAMLSKWLGLVDPQLLKSRAADTRPEYADFIIRAKQAAGAIPAGT